MSFTKILFISNNRIDQGFGGERWLFEVSKRLSANHSIAILTSDSGKIRTDFSAQLRRTGNVKVVELHHSRSSFQGVIGAPLNDIRNQMENSDIVYIMDFPIHFYQYRSLAKNLPNVRTVRGHHTPIAVAGSQPGPNFFIRQYYRHVKPMILRSFGRFSAHHVLTTSDRDAISNWVKTPIFCIPNGIDTGSYFTGEKYHEPTILFLGSLDRHKGFDLLPRLIKNLYNCSPSARVVILGDGELKYLALELARNHKNVTFSGFVSEKEKREILRRSHVTLMLSRWEAFSFSTLESLASGTPVVPLNILGPTSMIEDGKNGFICRDMQSMTEKLSSLISMIGTENYSLISNNARKSSLSYDWSIVIRDIESMLSKVACS